MENCFENQSSEKTFLKERIAAKLSAAGDFFTAGFFRGEDAFLGALTEYLENAPLPEYENTLLYPLKSVWHRRGILNYDYSASLSLDLKKLEQRALTADEKAFVAAEYGKLYEVGSSIEVRFALAGRGFTHYCPECRQFLCRSLPEYCALFDGAGALRCKMTGFGKALVGYVRRMIQYLRSFGTERAASLARAYESFLAAKAEDFFGAFVRIAFVFALDGFDSLGNIDLCLAPFEASADATLLFGELYDAYEKNNAWNFVIGGAPPMSAVAVSAFRGASRPNFSVKVDENTPDELWNACFSAMERGARPAFYNKRGYEQALFELGVKEADLPMLSYGGCSETMLAGLSNVGSIDAGLNMAQTLADTLAEGEFQTFESFFESYKKRLKDYVRSIVEEVNAEMRAMRSRPQYVRTFLCPPCAASGREYNDGGAAYYFSVINVCALANAADSLYALKKLVFENKRFSLSYLREILAEDFRSGSGYMKALGELEPFGNDNFEADELAKRAFDAVCDELALYRTAIGSGRFLPACIMFNTALYIGEITDATPDGRKARSPVADSGGAMTGRDRVSPTALLNSVARIKPVRAAGSWVVNMALSEGILRGENARLALKSLVLGFFEKGGNQLQINILDREKLTAAVDDDELAKSIIVRVGGFSERFSNLSREFRRNIAERTQY